jgi:TusA-related sulfurtransferase
MNKITFKDILPLPEYEKVRETLKRKVIQLKEERRIHLGEIVTVLFENQETVKRQIQEMMRVEHIYEEQKIQNEIDIYNALIPDQDELSATLFIEIVEESKIKPQLDQMIGLDNGKSLFFQIGPDRVYAKFEEGHSNESRISAVHYVRFNLTPEQIKRFQTQKDAISLRIDHINYQAETRLTNKNRESLSLDF